MYPEPPLLIRRALEDDVLPAGGTGKKAGFPILRGTDIFIALYNIHRSEEFWEVLNLFYTVISSFTLHHPFFNRIRMSSIQIDSYEVLRILLDQTGKDTSMNDYPHIHKKL